MIPKSFIQDLLNRLDIVDVIERYLPLKKAGANFAVTETGLASHLPHMIDRALQVD